MLKERCECYVSVNDPERKELWKKIFPDGQIPIEHPLAPLGGFFKVDLGRITKEQLEKMVKELSDKFGVSEEQIKEEVYTDGIPILNRNCNVAICSLHVRCML